MAKRFTDTDKWKKGFMKSLSTKYKLLWLYIVDDCNHAGIKGVDNIDTTDSPKTSLKRFKKPTTEEIQSYCTERKNNVDSMKFFNFYESNGWKVGKNAMKDWKASIRTWESNTTNKSNSDSKIGSQLNSWKGARDIIIQQQLNK